jgi:hypothetical protein
MAFHLENQIEDNLDDEVGRCLRNLHLNRTWTAEKKRLFAQLEVLTKRERYLLFTGDYRDYHLERKGQSCIYAVPLSQRGALKIYRGKHVRLICVGSWDQYAGRFFQAKPVKSGLYNSG